jgi:hypothetical protein
MNVIVTPIPVEAVFAQAPEWEPAIAAAMKVWLDRSSIGDRRKIIALFNAMLLKAPPPEVGELRQALAESLKLQSHYADLLNMHDGGERMQFQTVAAWLERLRSLQEQEAQKLPVPEEGGQ